MSALLAVVETGFATKLRDMLWTAYGAPVKLVGCILLVVLVGAPLFGFIKRISR